MLEGLVGGGGNEDMLAEHFVGHNYENNDKANGEQFLQLATYAMMCQQQFN